MPKSLNSGRRQSDSPGGEGVKITDVLKDLRRLRIHFPAFGEGFLFLALREFDFDCCDALEALRSSKLPECLESMPKTLSLIEARKICANEDNHSCGSDDDQASDSPKEAPVKGIEEAEVDSDVDLSDRSCTSEDSDAMIGSVVGLSSSGSASIEAFGGDAANACASIIGPSGGAAFGDHGYVGRASGSCPSGSHAIGSHVYGAPASDDRPSDDRPSDDRASRFRASSARPSGSHAFRSPVYGAPACDARPSDARPSDARPSDARPSDARPSDNRASRSRASGGLSFGDSDSFRPNRFSGRASSSTGFEAAKSQSIESQSIQSDSKEAASIESESMASDSAEPETSQPELIESRAAVVKYDATGPLEAEADGTESGAADSDSGDSRLSRHSGTDGMPVHCAVRGFDYGIAKFEEAIRCPHTTEGRKSGRLASAELRRVSITTDECQSPLLTARRRRNRIIGDDGLESPHPVNPGHKAHDYNRHTSPQTPSSLFSGSVDVCSSPSASSLQRDDPNTSGYTPIPLFHTGNRLVSAVGTSKKEKSNLDQIDARRHKVSLSSSSSSGSSAQVDARRHNVSLSSSSSSASSAQVDARRHNVSLSSSSSSASSARAPLIDSASGHNASPRTASSGKKESGSGGFGGPSPSAARSLASNEGPQRMALLNRGKEILKPLQVQRKQIHLVEAAPIADGPKSYTGDISHASGATLFPARRISAAVPQVCSYPADPPTQAAVNDTGLGVAELQSPSIISQFEKRKQLSERLREHEAGGVTTPITVDSTVSEALVDQSVYTNPLPFFFSVDDVPPSESHSSSEDSSGEGSEKGPPHPELHGFRWSSAKNRFYRDASCKVATFLRPRHVFMLGLTVYKKLYDYQILAVSWMFELFKLRAGGILGDEMGLGKTVQACALIRGLVSSGLATCFIILLPLTLLEQWKMHLKVWCPKVQSVVFHGSERRSALKTCMRTASPIAVLTTYETFRNAHHDIGRAPRSSCGPRTRMEQEAKQEGYGDPENWREQILKDQRSNDRQGSQPWDVAIFDEAHKIKNPRNQAAQAVRLLDAHCRILLTGTPVSNKLDELWALMDCANPGLLGNQRTFAREFADPIKVGSARHAPDHAVHRKNRIALELQKIIKPYVLRRTAQGTLGVDHITVSDESAKPTPMTRSPREVDGCRLASTNEFEPRCLPPKKDIIVWLELTPQQHEIYAPFLESRQVTSIFARSQKGAKGFNSMRAVGILLKLCRHPIFVLPHDIQVWRKQIWSTTNARSPAQSDEEEIQDLVKEQWFEKASDIDQRNPEALIAASGKLQFLYHVLPALQSQGHRCLLFSQSTKMLDLVEAVIMTRLDLPCLRIDGSVSGELRQLRLKQFTRNQDIFAMLMTTKVGGQGLNLTSADRVIMIDPDWTPTNDNQAVARAHRIGQTKPVVIYRLFTSGAIEDHAFRLQTFKQGIAKTALENTNQKTYFSHTEMTQMFTLRSRGDSETLRILDSVNQTKGVEQQLKEVMINDIGKDSFDRLSGIIGGLSDFDCLFNGLARQTAPSQEYDQLAITSSLKLRTENYDETQTMNAEWLRRARLKARK